VECVVSWFHGEGVSEMASSTFCGIVTPVVLQGASLVWKTIFFSSEEEVKMWPQCCLSCFL
jgi:hypothetical protein